MASLNLGKECPVPNEHEAGLAPKSGEHWRGEILNLLGIVQLLGCPAYNLVTVTIAIPVPEKIGISDKRVILVAF